MVERWNIGFQKDISHFNFIVNPVGGGTINPTLHYPLRGAEPEARTHYSTIPVFHHSNCERSELTCYITGQDCGQAKKDWVRVPGSGFRIQCSKLIPFAKQ